MNSKCVQTNLARKARQFTFELGVKSIITFPSFGHKLDRRGLYEIMDPNAPPPASKAAKSDSDPAPNVIRRTVGRVKEKLGKQ